MITKAQMLAAIRSLTDDATVLDAIERLGFIGLIEKRIAAAAAGETITQDEVERRVEARLQRPQGVTG